MQFKVSKIAALVYGVAVPTIILLEYNFHRPSLLILTYKILFHFETEWNNMAAKSWPTGGDFLPVAIVNNFAVIQVWITCYCCCSQTVLCSLVTICCCLTAPLWSKLTLLRPPLGQHVTCHDEISLYFRPPVACCQTVCLHPCYMPPSLTALPSLIFNRWLH